MSSDIRAGAAFVELYAKANLTAGLSAAENQLNAAAGKLGLLGAGMFGGALAAATGLASLVDVAQDQAGQIDDTAKRLGTSATEVQQLGYLATLAGSSMETMGKSLTKLDKNLADASSGSGAARKAFRDLGLDWNVLKAQTPTERLQSIATALQGLPDHASQTAAAMELLGKSGAELLPALAGGAEGIEQATRAARELGTIVSEDAVANLGVLGDQSDTIKAQLKAGFLEALGQAAPVLAEVGGSIVGVLRSLTRWTRENPELVKTITRLTIAGVGLVGVTGGATLGLAVLAKGGGLLAGGLRLAIAPAAGLTRQVFSLGASLIGLALNPTRAIAGVAGLLAGLASPLGLASIAATAGVAAWLAYSGSLSTLKERGLETLSALYSTGKQTFEGITAAIQAGDFATAGEVAISGLHTAWLQGLQFLETDTDSTWNRMLELLGSGDWSAAGRLAWDAIKVEWTAGLNWIAQSYDELENGFAQLFDDLYVGARNGLTRVTTAIVDAIGGVADWVLGLWEKASAAVDSTDANTELAQIKQWRESLADFRQQSAAGAEVTIRDRNSDARKREQERGQKIADLNKAYEDQSKSIDEQRKKLLERGDGESPLVDQLAAAQQRLAASVDKAMAAKDAAPRLPSGGGDGVPPPEDGAQGIATPTSTATFSAAAAATMLRGGVDPQKEIATNTADTAINTQRMARRLDNWREPVFG